MKSFPILRSIERVPGGLMVVPLMLGATIATFAPGAPKFFGSFTQSLFTGALTILAVFYVCMGTTIELTATPYILKKGGALLITKILCGIIAGLVLGRLLGEKPIAAGPFLGLEVWRTNKIGGIGDIPAPLERSAGLRAQSVELKTIRAGPKRLAAALDEHAAAKVHAVVCDAETDRDLSVIAQAAASRRQPTIFAGSAGLARHLPRAFDLIRVGTLKSETAKTVATPTTPLLFVIGSMSKVSREQLGTLAGEPGIRSIACGPAQWSDIFRMATGRAPGK